MNHSIKNYLLVWDVLCSKVNELIIFKVMIYVCSTGKIKEMQLDEKSADC